jgi:hypothetical protein
MSIKITLSSGAKLEITPLPYLKAWGVSQDVLKEVKKLNVDINTLKTIDFKNLLAVDALSFAGPLCEVLSNEKIIEAATVCMERCTYNGLKIDADTFEKIEARQDFLPVVFSVLKENISPFFANLFSFFMKN